MSRPERTPQGHEARTQVAVEMDLYDDEVKKIQGVLTYLNNVARHRPTTVAGWEDEIKTKFEEAGFRVSVVMHEISGREDASGHYEKADQILTSITVQGRVNDILVGEYDHERQRYNVRKSVGLQGSSGAAFFPSAAPGPRERKTASGLILPK
jgi:hypothetical protein